MIKITETEWMGDCTEMLAVQTRLAVEARIKDFLGAGVKPQIDFEKMQALGQTIGEKADVMMYPTKKTLDEANQIFQDMTNAIAVLAFVRGGIEMFGVRYEAMIDGEG